MYEKDKNKCCEWEWNNGNLTFRNATKEELLFCWYIVRCECAFCIDVMLKLGKKERKLNKNGNIKLISLSMQSKMTRSQAHEPTHTLHAYNLNYKFSCWKFRLPRNFVIPFSLALILSVAYIWLIYCVCSLLCFLRSRRINRSSFRMQNNTYVNQCDKDGTYQVNIFIMVSR